MALLAGTVALTPDGTAITSGLAGAIYDQFVNNYHTDHAGTGEVMPTGAESYPIKKGYMVLANNLATAIVTYVTANAQVSTSVSVVNVSGVTSGTSSSGPGSGTGTGTIL